VSSWADQEDIVAIRAAAARWVRAIDQADVNALAGLMTEEIVVVHGNGRCLTGREAVLADFAASFTRRRVMQQVSHDETTVSGRWALDRSHVETTGVPVAGGEARRFVSHTWTIPRFQPSHGWRLARVIGVLEQASSGE
jgi:uncharacterized protein (TIGR02246 family)